MIQKQNTVVNFKLLVICGLTGLFGCVSVVLTDIIGAIAVDGYNPISQTISELAITQRAWIQDTGLNLFALSFAACALGLYKLKLGRYGWNAGVILLFLLAIDILLISEHDKYAGREGVGQAIHIYLVYALGVLFALAPIFLAFGLRKLGRAWSRFSWGTAVAWGMLSPIFFIVPDRWDGAYERLVSLIMIGWVCLISWLLLRQGSRRYRASLFKL